MLRMPLPASFRKGAAREPGAPAREEKSDGKSPPRAGPGAEAKRRLLLVAAALLLSYMWLLWGQGATVRERISYSEFKAQLRDGNVAEVVVREGDIRGVFRLQAVDLVEGEAPAEGFVVLRPQLEDPDLARLLEEQEVEVSGERGTSSWLGPILSFLPLLLLVAFFVFGGRLLGRQMGAFGDRLQGFGQSKAVRYERGTSDVTFGDVAGLENAKVELGEVIEYLKDPSRFLRVGAKIPRGILLMGPPGTGKTLLARAAAGEAEVPFFSISGSEFIELFVGVGASRVRDLFDKAKKEAPAIIFIDEIDSVGRARGTGLGGGNDEREQTLNQILAAMDGFSAHDAVLVIAATNRPDVLDPALLRAGRFDRKITLDLPLRAARREILRVHTREMPLATDVDLADLAARTVGFSGADLENLANEAALLAARNQQDQVSQHDFEKARDRVLLGGERQELIIEAEKEIVAYHEAGHALVAKLLPGTDPLRKVTIIPRGRALGATEQMPEEERQNVTRSYLLGRITVLLGGRSAERLVFGDISTGAEDDLRKASQLARHMVCQWGMSDELGPVSYRLGEEQVFLGREMAQVKDYSELTGSIIDQEVRKFVREMEEEASGLLAGNRVRLDVLATALLKRETLDAGEVDDLLAEAEPQPS